MGTRIQILSDLHLEFMDFELPETDADVIVLAGDIHLKAQAIDWISRNTQKPVVYVAGNHEYYKGSLGHTFKKMKDYTQGTNIHLLENESVVLDGVRFLGATLWTDYRLTGNEPLAMWDAQQNLSDFKTVRDELYRKVRPYQLAARHARTRNFIEATMAEPFEGKTVVVTHHAPSSISIPARYRDSKDHINASYASSLEHLMENVAVWAHGHVHDSIDELIGDTRIICNPRGYAPSHLNPNFNPSFVITVP